MLINRTDRVESSSSHSVLSTCSKAAAKNSVASVLAALAFAGLSSQVANAAVVSACSGVSLPPSVVTGVLGPVLGALSPLLNIPPFNLGTTLTSINNGAPISLQVIDTSGNVVSNTAPCVSQADVIQLATPAGIAFGGNQITGLGNGTVATANDINAIAIGNNASTTSSATRAVAIGYNSTVSGVGSVALGANTVSNTNNSVALGNGSVTTAPVATASTTIAGTTYSFAGSTPVGNVSIGSTGNERTITNLSAGRLSPTSTDAVNGSQLYATNTAVDSLATTLNNINNGSGIRYFHSNSTLTDSVAGGVNSVAIGPGSTTAAIATNAIAMGNGSNAGAVGSLALGAGANTAIANNIAIGTNAIAGAANGGWAGTTIGGTVIASNVVTANAVLGISGGGINRQIQGVADGAVNSTSTDAVNGSQLFYSIQALTTALVTPVNAPIAADNVNGLSGPSVAAGQNGVAIGYGAKSTGSNSVAVGNGSNDSGRSNVLSVGSAGSTRQIINVASGTRATDAVNVSQLQPLVTALGGGATINTVTGTVAGPTYNVGGVNYADVGSAVAATNRLSVQYTPDANGNPTNKIVLSGANNGQPVSISNVAAGINGTDAVNVNQLRSVNGRIDQIASSINSLSGDVAQNQTEARRGIATTAAMANLPFGTTPGKWSPAISFGGFKNQTAVAMGVQYNVDGAFRVKVRATASFVPGSNDITFGGGAGMEF